MTRNATVPLSPEDRMLSPLVATGTFAAGFLLGALPPSLSAIAPQWGRKFRWDAAECERQVRRGFVVPLIILLPVAGFTCDLWQQPKSTTLIGLIAIIVGLVLLALIPQARTAVTNLLGLAFGVAFLAVGLIAWMPSLLGSPNRPVETINLGFIAITLGWLFGRELVERSVRWLGLTGVLCVGAAIATMSLILLSHEHYTPTRGSPPEGVVRNIHFWLLLLAMALYFPVESCLEIWSGPFLRGLGDQHYYRSRIFGFWCAYLLARLATYALVRTGYEPWFLVTCAAIAAMALGNLVGAYGRSSGGIGFWIVGFCYGPLLPGVLGLFGKAFPERFGLIIGSLLALGTIYRTALSPVLNRYLLSHSPRQAMRVPALLTLLLAAPLLVVTLMK